jgi:hypothetical protein
MSSKVKDTNELKQVLEGMSRGLQELAASVQQFGATIVASNNRFMQDYTTRQDNDRLAEQKALLEALGTMLTKVPERPAGSVQVSPQSPQAMPLLFEKCGASAVNGLIEAASLAGICTAPGSQVDKEFLVTVAHDYFEHNIRKFSALKDGCRNDDGAVNKGKYLGYVSEAISAFKTNLALPGLAKNADSLVAISGNARRDISEL